MNDAMELPDPGVPEIDDDDVREPLMARTAELLGVPVRARPIRACWRSGDCRFVDPDTFPNRPWCLDQLPDAERAGFDALYTRVRAAIFILLLEAEPLPSPDPETASCRMPPSRSPPPCCAIIRRTGRWCAGGSGAGATSCRRSWRAIRWRPIAPRSTPCRARRARDCCGCCRPGSGRCGAPALPAPARPYSAASASGPRGPAASSS